MINLEYSVAGQLISASSVPQYLVADTVGIYRVVFTFDSDWSGLGEKTAVFRNPSVIDVELRDVPVEFPLDENNSALIPGAILDPGKLFIGVYGVNGTQQMPTIWAPPMQVVPGASPGVDAPDDPAIGTAVRTAPQTLTEAEQAQARENIGAIGGVEGDEGNVVIIGSNQNIADSKVSKDNLILAPQLASNNYKTDSVPYIYRQTGGGIGVGNREYDSIVGGSVVYNQLVEHGNFVTATGWAFSSGGIFSVSNNVGIITCTSGIVSTSSFYTSTANRIANHRYYYHAEIKEPVQNSTQLQVNGVYNSIVASANTWVTYDGFVKPSANGSGEVRFYFNRSNALASGDVVNIKNVMLIDVTKMFGSTVADALTVDMMKAMFGIGYLQYSAPSLESVSGLQKHQMKDADGNVIAEYPLDDSLTLRGVAVLDDNNNIKFDGDTYASDGTVTRRYGIVDLGTVNWVYASAASDTRFFTTSLDCNAPTSISVTVKAVCALYATMPYNQVNGRVSNDMVMGAVKSGGTDYFAIKNLSYTSAAAFKTAMSGVYLIYELATPTTETAEPYDAVQICDPLGTEEYVTTGIVPVGHETRYPENQVAKLDGLPSDFSRIIAPTEKAYKATRTYTVGRLLIVNNILYKVISAISSGATLTVGTNISETTLDEVIASL